MSAGLCGLALLGIALVTGTAAWADPGERSGEEAVDALAPAATGGIDFNFPSENAEHARSEYRPPYTPRWGTMIGEAILLFSVQELFYWTLMLNENVVDFDYGLDERSLRSRFVTLDAWRLDNNMYDTNALRHPAQGMANYLFARSNTLTVPSSYLFSFVFSTGWEVIGEFREIVSINDLVMTPGTAMPIAEALAQMGAFLGFYDWIEKARPRWMRNLGAVWLDGPIWHDFRLGMAGGVRDHDTGTGTTSQLSLDTELIRIAGYGQPGNATHLLMNGNFSQLSLRSGFDEGGLNDFLFFARAALVTYYRKSIAEDGSRGYDLILGASSAFEYGMHWLNPGHDHASTRDQTAIAHLVGPTIDGRLHRGDLNLRAVIDVYGDFAMVRNYALGKLRAAEGDDGMKSSIRRESYHYALGVTAMGRAMARYQRFEAGLQLQYDLFESIEGLDRYQEDVMVDHDLDDRRALGRAWLSHDLPVRHGATSARIILTATERRRSGTVGEYADASREREYMGGLVLGF